MHKILWLDFEINFIALRTFSRIDFSPVLNILKMDPISFLKLGYKTLKYFSLSCEDN